MPHRPLRIVHLVAGAGGMYCGSCLQGNTLVRALQRAGHEVTLVPLYTPLRTDEPDASLPRLAFGGINVYLQQRAALFRHVPGILDKLLDSPRLLRWLARRGGATRPERLGALTVSMLRGEQGRQRRELEKLLHWLASELRPELVHLNNALLVGLAREIQRRLNIPVVSTFAGEDAFIARLPAPFSAEATAVLAERCAELAGLVAMNNYYAAHVSAWLGIDRQRIIVIPPGLDLEGYAQPPVSPEVLPRREASTPATIGFLARLCPDKGLHILFAAWRMLATDGGLPGARLKVAGSLQPGDRPYLRQLESKAAGCGLAGQFTYCGELDRPAKIAFLQSLDVFCLPTTWPESKGLPVLEAWANGVPAVLPAHGAFVEMMADTGGGLLCPPNDPAALAAALQRLLSDRALARQCGWRAQRIVHHRYRAESMAERTLALYHRLLAR